jgi:DNA/RNA endonuclease G (NUC1)
MSDRWPLCAKGHFVFLFSAVLSVAVPDLSWARLGADYQMALGNPTQATTDPSGRTNYLLARSQYALSYNDNTHQANWACWSYSTGDVGADVPRTDAFAADTDLPIGYVRISSATFGGDWDRGHICPSEDRVFSTTDNQMTFRMSNMMPQASANNRGPWARFEAYCRELAADGGEVLIMAGPAEFTGATISNGMATPGAVWKIAVVVPDASSTATAASRVTTNCRVIAIVIPNTSLSLGSWQDYIVKVEDIERITGFHFFSAVDASTAVYLKNVVDTGIGPNSPTVVTAFSPASGTPGTTVTIHGYNFGGSPLVSVNGVPATVLSSSGTVITATLNNTLAGVGPINVTGTGGTDQSYADFTVFSGTQPGFSLSTFTLNGLVSVEGKSGAANFYTVSGANLTGPITVTAPLNFEISPNNSTNSFGGSLNLTPSSGSLLGVPVYVRIKSTAPFGPVSGTITHSGGGAIPLNLTVSGEVASGVPSLTLSPSSLSNFFSIQGKPSASQSYLISGKNLSNNITLAASSTNYEISLNNVSFAQTLSLSPTNEALANVPVYVRLSSSSAAGNNSGVINNFGSGATPQALSLSGYTTGSNYLIAWNFFETSSPSSMLPSSADPALDGGLALVRGTKATASTANNSFRTEGFKDDGISIANTDYFEFGLSVENGKALSLTQITAVLEGTDTFVTGSSHVGATNQFSYSINGGSHVLIGNPTIITSISPSGMTVDLSGVNDLQNLPANTTVTLRFYASGQTTTGGWGFYSGSFSTVGLGVVGTIAKAPPIITSVREVSGTVRANFNYWIIAENSPTLFAASGLPAGLIIDSSSGRISGAPLVTGVFPVALMASNEAGQSSANLTLTILEPVNINPVTLAKWTFESATSTGSGTTPPSYRPEEGLQTNTASASSVHSASATYSLPAGNGSTNSFSANKWAMNDYFQFSMNSSGYRSLRLKFDQTGSGTGPLQFKLAYSVNGSTFIDYANYDIPQANASSAIGWSATSPNSNSTLNFDLSSVAQLANKTNLVFRLVQSGTTSLSNGTVQPTGTSRVDNVEISGVPLDSNPPVILLTGDSILRQVAGSSWSDPGVAAVDAEDSSVAVMTSGAVNAAVLGSYLLTYSAVDSSGNSALANRTVEIILNSANSGSIDSDGNGMSDLIEYALGGKPTGNSMTTLPAIALTENNLQITFQARTNDNNLVIQPLANTSLSSTGWSSSDVTKISAVPVLGKEGFETQVWATPVNGADRKFLKVNITR